jgi:hypothetical protein
MNQENNIKLFEPTEEQKKCQHDKSYAPYILVSDPPQYPWICRKCGLRGIDYGEVCFNDYHETLEKFKIEKIKNGVNKL